MQTHVFYSDEHKAVCVSITSYEEPPKNAPTRTAGITAWMSPEDARTLLRELTAAIAKVPATMVASDLGGSPEPMPTPPTVGAAAPAEGQTAASAAGPEGEILF